MSKEGKLFKDPSSQSLEADGLENGLAQRESNEQTIRGNECRIYFASREWEESARIYRVETIPAIEAPLFEFC